MRTGKLSVADSMQSRKECILRSETMGKARVVIVWLAVAVVFLLVNAWVGDSIIHWTLIAAGGSLLLFNTASMVVMIRHYHEE